MKKREMDEGRGGEGEPETKGREGVRRRGSK